MQVKKWLVHFNGADRFEQFETYGDALNLLKRLQEESGCPT
jgi:hypothetical protein